MPTNPEKLRTLQARYQGETIVFMAMASGYSHSQVTEFVSEVAASEATDAGDGTDAYARQPAASVTFTQDDVNALAYLDCDDVNFGAVHMNEDVAGVLYYVQRTSDADHEVIGYDAFAAPFVTDGTNPLTAQISPLGLLREL